MYDSMIIVVLKAEIMDVQYHFQPYFSYITEVP